MIARLEKPADLPKFLVRWYEITTPRPLSANATFQQREKARRSRAASTLLLLMAVLLPFTLVVSLVEAVFTKAYLFPTVMAGVLVMILFLTWLNRHGWTSIVALTFITGMVLATLALLIGTPGGITIKDMPLYDNMVSSLLLAVMLLPLPSIFFLAVANFIFVVITLYYFASPALAQVLHANFGSVVSHFFSLELEVTTISVLWALSMRHSIKRADRAEEVARLEQALATQNQAVLEEKQMLEESVRAIVETHTAIANGYQDVRVPVNNQNILRPVVGSLTGLLNRVQSWRQESQELQQLRAAVTQVARQANEARRSGKALRFERTGTALDSLLAELQYVQKPGSQPLSPQRSPEQFNFPSSGGAPGNIPRRDPRNL
ncbi:MAG TPA: hypothetical protein VFV38_07435 [Ktedonobacteraceae bacterium]|nr:hypothetical protein [Ktedonobacteraceae bacterium]